MPDPEPADSIEAILNLIAFASAINEELRNSQEAIFDRAAWGTYSKTRQKAINQRYDEHREALKDHGIRILALIRKEHNHA